MSVAPMIRPDAAEGPIAPIDLQAAAQAEVERKDRQRRKAPPMRETAADRAVADAAYGIAAEELRQFIERYEQLDAEKKDIAEAQKDLMAEAKARGFDTKAMRKIVALRKKDPDTLAEEEAVLEIYKSALGMA